MAEQTGLVVRYTAPPSASLRESRWIRLEQLQPEDESLTVAEAAQAIDELFGIEPCEQGLGGGGEATEYDEDGLPSERPEETRFDRVMRGVMGEELCGQAQYWHADVLVLRSHRAPGYTLRSESAELVRTSLVRKRVQESVDFGGGTSADLGWPYAGDLSGIPAGIEARVLGSTVNLSAPADHLTLSYSSEYEQVRLRVPVVEQPETNEQDRLQRPELPGAAVVAFWGGLAAACELSPPEQDESVSQDELEQFCRGADTGYGLGGPKNCWQTLEHYSLCNCSRRKTGTWSELVAATCPEGTPPGTHYLGSRGKLDGYVYCEGEEDEVNDPEYYEAKCCTPPPRPLPRCRKTYAVYHGGAAIEGGAASWRSIYGANVRLVPVSPKGGVCGELITEWQVDSKNCCEDIERLKPHPNNPTTISPGSAVWLQVEDGKPVPLKWTATGGLQFRNGQSVLQEGGRREQVFAPVDICPNSTITVDDTCYPLQLHLHAPDAPPLRIPPGDRVVAPGGTIMITATGGVSPYQWASDQLELLTNSGHSAMFHAPANFCGSATITVSDVCTQTADCGVRSTKGWWKLAPNYNQIRCELPFSGEFTQTGYNSGVLQGDGYRIRVSVSHTSPCSATPRCPGDNVLVAELSNQEYCQRHMGYQSQYWRSEYRGGGQCWSVPVSNPSGAGCIGTVHQFAYNLEEWVCA